MGHGRSHKVMAWYIPTTKYSDIPNKRKLPEVLDFFNVFTHDIPKLFSISTCNIWKELSG